MIVVKLSTIFLLLCLFDFSSQDDKRLRTNTSLGTIRGYYKISRHGREYEAYEGIPYAQPPVGKLRFQPPQPVHAWSGELPAIRKSARCVQYLSMSMAINGERVVGSEDCLYMNIYVPIRNCKTLLPVIFWIHGGAFTSDTGNNLNETLIMDRDVVLVGINYRLGPLGFLSTEDSVVPGNMGLKDQNLALRWVSNNIENFGGDPKQITLMGFSAGGASVHYHYLTPLSAGLFQRGISISGVALDSWTETKRDSEKAKKLGALMGCPTSNVREMIHCLQTRHPWLITRAIGNFMYWLNNPAVIFGPVIEKSAPHAFITRSPIDVINSGDACDVPWISGIVSEEGIYVSGEFMANNALLKQLNDNWDDIAPYLLDYNYTIPLNQQEQVSEKIRRHYFESEPIDNTTVMPIIQMLRDRFFAYDFEKVVRLQARKNKNPVWSYFYSYRSMYSLSEILTGTTRNFGVCHSDDVNLVIDTKTSGVTQPRDLQMQQIMLDFYTSFAIDGKPSMGHADWQSLVPNDKDLRYLHIASPTSINMESSSDFGEKSFWSTIIFEENKIN